MTGSEKQVKYAEDIKAGLIADMDRFISDKAAGKELPASLVAQRIMIIELFDSVTEAAWMIENGAGNHWQFVAKAIKAAK